MAEGSVIGRLSGVILGLIDRHFDVVGRQLDSMMGREDQSKLLSPEDAEVLYLQARYMLKSGRVKEALPLFERAATLAPELWDAAEGYGEAADQLNQPSLASANYEASRRRKAFSRRATPDRPHVLRRTGRLATEIANYTWQLQSNKDSPFLYVARGNAHLAQGKPERALADYSAALGVNAHLAQAMTLKGEAYTMMGEYEQAKRAFDSALKEDPFSADALSGRAIALLASSKIGDANVDWRHQLAVLPPVRAAARACVALRLAEYALARAELDCALAQQPDDLYWRLYRLTTAARIGEPYLVGAPVCLEVWPGPLIELHAGRLGADEVHRLADHPARQAEAHFQLAILELPRRPEVARDHFERVVKLSPPALIEHAAARHELMRWSL